MMEAELPDGTVLEFPDGTSPEVMQRVVKSRLGQAPAPVAPAVAPKAPDSIARQVGLTARAGVKGVASLPALMTDAATGLYNTGADQVQGPNQGFRFKQQMPLLEALMTRMGLPEPQDAGERVVQDATSAMAGAGGAMGAASKLLPPQLSQLLTAKPGIQLSAAAGGGASAAGVREEGGGPGAQLASGLAGGLVGGLVPGAASVARQPISRIAQHLTEPMSQAGRDQIKGRLMNTMAGPRKPDVIDALQKNRLFVPGTSHTAATVASPAGSTEFAALEKILARKYAPSDYADVEAGNESARMLARFNYRTPSSGRLIEKADRARELRATEQASLGNEAARRHMGLEFREVEPPGMLDRGVMLLRAGLSALQGGGRERTLKELVVDLRDPAKVARLMQGAAPQDKMAMSLALKQLGVATTMGTAQSFPQLVEER